MKEEDPEALREIPEHWVRFEIEIKGDRADYIGEYYETIDFREQVRRYIEFREGTTSRIERSPVCDWWLTFLSATPTKALRFFRATFHRSKQ